MRNYHIAIMFLSLGLCLTLISPTLAMRITNITASGSTVLFEDDFEGISPVCTTVFGVDTGDYDPVPTIGSYNISETNPNDLQVCSGSDGDDLGPFEGNNYMRMTRVSNMSAYAVFAQSATSGTILLETMLGLTGSNPRSGPLGLMNGGTLGAYFLIDIGGVVKNYVGGYKDLRYDANYQYTTDSTGTILNFTPNQWHEVSLKYALGEGTYTLSIDDITVTDIPVNTTLTSANQIRMLAGSPGDGSTNYFDHVAEVPEPGTIVLLLCGGLTGIFLARRRV